MTGYAKLRSSTPVQQGWKINGSVHKPKNFNILLNYEIGLAYRYLVLSCEQFDGVIFVWSQVSTVTSLTQRGMRRGYV